MRHRPRVALLVLTAITADAAELRALLDANREGGAGPARERIEQLCDLIEAYDRQHFRFPPEP